MLIPFNKPYVTGKEISCITEALASGHLSGDGTFTKRCSAWLETKIGVCKALLTHSGTAALEMAAVLANVRPGDEVIMPSYTFVSTANAFVLRGAVPVFVDIRPDTLNIDETKIESAITAKTRVIVPVHYAGVACEMDTIMAVASRHGLLVIEDNAQGMTARYKGKPLGSFGHMAAVSFHETKNIMCGEGGALLINDPLFVGRAEIIREKGTNRSLFFRGEVDKYSWVDIGSSFLPGELIAAFLWGQTEDAEAITQRRLALWEHYHRQFACIEERGRIRRPIIPAECQHNAHLYYLILAGSGDRARFIDYCRNKGVQSVFHYVPLHSAPMGRQVGRPHGRLSNTEDIAGRVVRLPLWVGLEEYQAEVVQCVLGALGDLPASEVS